jgi:hypothetical protein
MWFYREHSVERESVIEGAFFVLAMLFFADSGRHVRCF